MRFPLLHRLIAYFSLLVLFCSGPAAAHSLVWCIGADGHIALEAAEAGECAPGPGEGPAAGGHSARGPELTGRDDHCGPCLDFAPSLHAASGSQRPQQLLLVAVLPVFAAQSSHLRPDVRTLWVTPAAPPDAPDPILRALRTIILLI